jgi:hypothetical protein
MSIVPESIKDNLEETVQQVVDQAVEKAVPILNIKIPELVAEMPEIIIKDDNVKKCFPSFNFMELFRSLMSGLTKKKNIVSSE